MGLGLGDTILLARGGTGAAQTLRTLGRKGCAAKPPGLPPFRPSAW